MRLIDGVTAAPYTGQAIAVRGELPQILERTFQGTVIGTGAVTATIVVEVTNDIVNNVWLTLATFSLSGTTSATDGVASAASWTYVRARLTAISGTSAAAYCTMGV